MAWFAGMMTASCCSSVLLVKLAVLADVSFGVDKMLWRARGVPGAGCSGFGVAFMVVVLTVLA